MSNITVHDARLFREFVNLMDDDNCICAGSSWNLGRCLPPFVHRVSRSNVPVPFDCSSPFPSRDDFEISQISSFFERHPCARDVLWLDAHAADDCYDLIEALDCLASCDDFSSADEVVA